MHRINADKLSQFTDKLILADIIPEVAVKLSEISLLRIYNSCVSKASYAADTMAVSGRLSCLLYMQNADKQIPWLLQCHPRVMINLYDLMFSLFTNALKFC